MYTGLEVSPGWRYLYTGQPLIKYQGFAWFYKICVFISNQTYG